VVLHLASFSVVSFLGILAWNRRRMRVVLALAMLGGLIELGQGAIGRDAEFLDWFSDLGGIAVALAAASLINRNWLLRRD
jgi:hypothetical protein